MTDFSLAQRLAALPEQHRAEVFAGLEPEVIEALNYEWALWARPEQLAPVGDWRVWLVLAGRGWGKTKTAAEWVRSEITMGRRRQFGIVGPTADALRRVQVEGPSGVLNCHPPGLRPSYEPSMRRIVWPNGAVAHLFSAEEPDRMRGPNLDAAWCDEITSWANLQECWDMMSMALRVPGAEGAAPQVIVTTTPKPSPTLKAIMAASSTVITRGRTSDNAANLDSATLAYLNERYAGTTLGRQELDAELLEEAEGALWSRELIEAHRGKSLPDDLKRVVVAVDPAGGSQAGNDETGIIAAGIRPDGHIYIMADASGRYSPDGWARRAVDAYRLHKADRIVAEQNFGGAMVEATIRLSSPHVPVKMVHASRGKAVRAEPVVALYEQGKIHHVGSFPALEDQLCQWVPGSSKGSPDRLDALVWAITELALKEARPSRFTNIPFMGR